ncbi:hypothetical protein ACFQ9X_02600 [Catenulispora yoronensis]
MARPTVVAWAACAVLTLAGSLTVGGIAAAKVREEPRLAPASPAPALTAPAQAAAPAAAPGEQTVLPAAVNAAGEVTTAGSAAGSAKAGGSITQSELDAFLAAHSTALKGKDRAAFLAAVDPKNADLLKQQGQLYDNLQKIPFASAAYRFGSMDGGESTFAQGAQATVAVNFDHQITGVDTAPVEEQYRWTVVRGATGLQVTAVDAPTNRRGYPAPWDSIANLTVLTRKHVVIMADDTSSSFAKSRADALESDAQYDFAHWTGGTGTAPGFAVFLTSNRDTYEGIYDQGRDESVGVTVPMPAVSDPSSAGGTYPSSRIAIDTTHYKNLDPADADIIFKHEMTHAMIDPFENLSGRSEQDHLWVVEGFAEWESQRMYSPRSCCTTATPSTPTRPSTERLRPSPQTRRSTARTRTLPLWATSTRTWRCATWPASGAPRRWTSSCCTSTRTPPRRPVWTTP